MDANANARSSTIALCEHCSGELTNDLCAQWRLRSAWASAQPDQNLHSASNGYLRTQCFFMRTAKTTQTGQTDWADAQADLSSLSTHAILLVLSWDGSLYQVWQQAWSCLIKVLWQHNQNVWDVHVSVCVWFINCFSNITRLSGCGRKLTSFFIGYYIILKWDWSLLDLPYDTWAISWGYLFLPYVNNQCADQSAPLLFAA